MHRSFREKLLSIFPPPQFLRMPSVGIDISDNSLKFIELHQTKDGLRIGRFGEEKVPPGIVVQGKIQKGDALVEILKKVRQQYGMHFVRATLPEERGYLFELSLPDMGMDEMAGAIEFRLEENVPIVPSEAVFGYDLLSVHKGDSKGKKVRRAIVSVFPRAATEAYAKLFYDAGLVPLSLETEPQAITRAVVPSGDTRTYLIVDLGRQRSGISIVSDGSVRFATTTDVGGDPITEAFQKYYAQLSHDEIVELKNTKGLRALHEENDSAFIKEVEDVVENLVQHIKQHLRYWNTREEKNKHGGKRQQVAKVLLCGGNANLGGLTERLSQELKLPVALANVWVNTFSLEQHIPSGVSFEESLGYAPAIGLALHGVHPVMRNRHMANLLPTTNLQKVRKERRNRIIITDISAFLLTVVLGIVFLIPSLLLSRTQATSAERKIELTRTFIAQREESGVLEEVRSVQQRIERLDTRLNDTVFSDVFNAIDASVPSGIQLNNIGYNRTEDADEVSITGVATTRDALLLFTRQLDHQELLTEVVLPVSNLASNVDIRFSLTLQVPDTGPEVVPSEETSGESS